LTALKELVDCELSENAVINAAGITLRGCTIARSEITLDARSTLTGCNVAAGVLFHSNEVLTSVENCSFGDGQHDLRVFAKLSKCHFKRGASVTVADSEFGEADVAEAVTINAKGARLLNCRFSGAVNINGHGAMVKGGRLGSGKAVLSGVARVENIELPRESELRVRGGGEGGTEILDLRCAGGKVYLSGECSLRGCRLEAKSTLEADGVCQIEKCNLTETDTVLIGRIAFRDTDVTKGSIKLRPRHGRVPRIADSKFASCTITNYRRLNAVSHAPAGCEFSSCRLIGLQADLNVSSSVEVGKCEGILVMGGDSTAFRIEDLSKDLYLLYVPSTESVWDESVWRVVQKGAPNLLKAFRETVLTADE
jgi:hypothetical protein